MPKDATSSFRLWARIIALGGLLEAHSEDSEEATDEAVDSTELLLAKAGGRAAAGGGGFWIWFEIVGFDAGTALKQREAKEWKFYSWVSGSILNLARFRISQDARTCLKKVASFVLQMTL